MRCTTSHGDRRHILRRSGQASCRSLGRAAAQWMASLASPRLLAAVADEALDTAALSFLLSRARGLVEKEGV